MEIKLVVSNPSDGTSKTVAVTDEQVQSFIGLRIKDFVSGEVFGFPDSEIVITGGSDKGGIPLRSDIAGGAKRYILLSGGTGFKPRKDGERKRKLVRGNMITEDIVQINAVLRKVEEAGKKSE